MGILGNVINNIATGAISLGFGQLDKYITRQIQEGNTEEAFRALDQFEQEIANRFTQAQQGNTQGILTLPEISPDISQSPLARQLAYQRGNQFIQQNPIVSQRELQQKAQEQAIGARKSAAGTLGGRGELGTQEITDFVTGGKQFPSNFLQQRRQQGRSGYVTASEQAKEPFRQKAQQRRIQLKQTPTFKQLQGGGGPSKPVNIPSTILNRWDKLGKRRGMTTAGESPMANLPPGVDPKDAFMLNLIAGNQGDETLSPEYGAVQQRAAEIYTQRRQNKQSINPDAIFDQAYNEVVGGGGTPQGKTPAPQKGPAQKKATTQLNQEAQELVNKYGLTPEVRQFLQSKGLNPDDYAQ